MAFGFRPFSPPLQTPRPPEMGWTHLGHGVGLQAFDWIVWVLHLTLCVWGEGDTAS